MVGGTGTQELIDSQTRTGATLQQPDPRDEQCGGEEGREAGSHPFPPGAQADTAAGEAGEAGPASLRAAGVHSSCWASATPSPQCLAHSKVSHCFLSCSTEPGAGAGAGLTSCLVFRSKSSKGSLAS